MIQTILLAVLAAPAAAQNLRATLITPGAITIRLAPALSATSVTPRLTATILPTLTPALLPALPAVMGAAVPVSAPSPIPAFNQTQEAARPALEALSAPNPSAAGAHSIGIALEDALTGRHSFGAVFAAPLVPVNGALPTARSAPAVAGVSYARSVSAAQRGILDESLRRRKAGWFRGLARMGVVLEGPIAPTLKVTKADGTAFTVEWTQGRTRLGAFRVVVPVKDPEPEFRRLAEPATADAKQVVVRFKSGTAEPGIRALFESLNMRVLAHTYQGIWTAAVTGRDRPASAAKKLSDSALVLSAAPKTAAFAEADQLLVAFKNIANDAALSAAFARYKLTVIEKTRDGLWRVGTPKGRAAKVNTALEKDAAVLYARTLEPGIPETRQSIVNLRAADEEIFAALLRRHELTVLNALGERSWKVAGALPSAELAAALASDAAVESTVAVGSLDDAAVDAAANGTASYKGRPWSSTEYNLSWAMGYDSLRRRGATEAQLKRYETLTAEAPVRGGSFNPWSGD